MPPTLDPQAILRARFRIQRLAGPQFRTPVDAVRHLAAFQAQDVLGAKWSLGMRVKGATDVSVDAALNAGKIIRTHLLRPTWHFVAPEDLGWILRLGAPQVKRIMSYSHDHVGLTPKSFRTATKILERELGGGRHRTRPELAASLAEGKLTGGVQWLAHLLLELEQEGLICSGRPSGKQQTYALVDEWVKPGPSYSRAESVARLAQRFFEGHGPATMKQFAWWSGLTLGEARKAREALKGLDFEAIDGTEWIFPPLRSTRTQKPAAYLIPEYDEVLTGWADIGIPRFISDRRKGKPTYTFDRPILHDGRWIGTWRRTIEPKRVVLEVQRFGKWTAAAERAVAAEGKRYAAFVGVPVVLA